jgi:hypothetical protein
VTESTKPYVVFLYSEANQYVGDLNVQLGLCVLHNSSWLFPLASMQDVHAMTVFEIQQWTSLVSDGRRPFVPDDISGYIMSKEAEAALNELMEPYGNSSLCLDRILNPLGGGHWCFVCLDKEYSLAGHITEARRNGVDLGSDVGFTPLARTPNPVPPDYYPAVGILVFASKTAAEAMASRSRLFERA